MKFKSLLLALLLFLPSVFAAEENLREVEAKGSAAIFGGNVANARRQALANAQRNAVEQGVGVLLDSRTVLSNLQTLSDQVFSSSQGFIKSYQLLSEGRSPDQSSYQVKIRARVSQFLLKDKLTALRILHKKMGNLRVMVVYHKQNTHALPREHGAAMAALLTLREKLNRAGFRVFSEEMSAKISQQIERASRIDRPVDDLIVMALDQRADILLRLENIAGKRGAQGGLFSAAFSTLRISAYDTITGQQITAVQEEGKHLLRAKPGPYDWEKGLAQAATKAAQRGAEESIAGLISYYQQQGDRGTAFLIVFKGFDDDQKDQIIDFLENTPNFQQLSELKNTVDYLELELFSSEKPSRLRRIIRAGLKTQSLPLRIQFSSRNRIVFSNSSQ